MFYVSIDPRGELAWDESTFGYGGVQAHVLEVLTDSASNAYRDFLRRRAISYIIAGDHQVDYELMLAKLGEMGIERLMVGGGGTINWSFMQSGLVDEVSMVLSPIANGDPDGHRFFTAREPYSTISPVAFDLTSVEHLGDGVVWLRYTPKTDENRTSTP
ncbi:MAG: RibD family protein [Acidimicrobiia bacterium]